MKNENLELLATITGDILEQFAFIFIDEQVDTCNTDINEWDCIGSKIDFTGDFSGKIELHVSADLAKEIAENMLAIENVTDQQKLEDGIKELCNIITGNFITAAYKSNDVKIGIPTTIPLGSERIAEDKVYTWFNVDNNQILIILEQL